MRVCTPIADLEISIDRLSVENGALVMTNAESDAIATRAIMRPQDVRRIVAGLLRPRVLWFALRCLFRSDGGAVDIGDQVENHPTPNPW